MSDENVIDFNSRKKSGGEPPKQEVTPGVFEFHFFPNETDEGEVTQAEGYLKFGPQFIAVTIGPEDTAPVAFACATGILKYVKKIDSHQAIQSTLSF